MKFQNPAGLWLLLGIPVLIIIYLIKAQHEDYPVSSTYIWKLSSRFMKKRLPMQKIKKILTFVMQLLMIVAVSLIAARPAIVNGESCDYIAIIDASASMQIRDENGTSRFEYAIAKALELTDEITNGHTVSIILASDSASYLVQGSKSVNEVKLALSNANCTYSECDAEEAISLAQLMCDRSNNAEVIFYTDCEYAEVENISIINLNQNEWNVALESLSAKKDGKNIVFNGTLTSYNKDVSVTVGLKIDGSTVDAQIVECVSGQSTEIIFTSENVSSYDTAEIYIESEDGLKADNSYAICRKSDRTYGVLLVSESPLYLESALKALGNCEVTVVSSLAEAELTGQDLYVFDGISPEEYPTDGSVLVFGTDHLPDGLTANSTSTSAVALSMNSNLQSDIYEGLSFSGTVVTNYASLLGNAVWEFLLYCGDDAVLATQKQNSGLHFTVASFDLHDSNWPMQTDFVLFVRNIVEYSVPGMLKDTDYTAGETIALTVMPATEQLYIELPNESIKVLSTAGETCTYTANDIGIYTAVMTTVDGGEYVDFFVHLLEGEVTKNSGNVLKIQLPSDTDVSSDEAVSEMWFWIAVVMLLIVLLEWGWYYHEQY